MWLKNNRRSPFDSDCLAISAQGRLSTKVLATTFAQDDNFFVVGIFAAYSSGVFMSVARLGIETGTDTKRPRCVRLTSRALEVEGAARNASMSSRETKSG